MENKKILSEISRIKDIFNYGALLNEQTTYEKYSSQSYTNNYRYKKLIDSFKKVFPDKEFFVTPGMNKLKYTNSQGIDIILRTKNEDNRVAKEEDKNVVDGTWGTIEGGRERVKGKYIFKDNKLEFV